MILFLFTLASYYIKLQSMASYNTKEAVKHQYLWYLYLYLSTEREELLQHYF